MSFRKAKHAGSWYPALEHELSNQLFTWLDKVPFTHGPARAIIVPHAGYKYCGACSAHAYSQINPQLVKRIFILGPSHHVSLSGCGLTSVSKYKTPLYDLQIDTQVNKELKMTGQFEWIDLDVDEKEHSVEMQLPFIAKVMESRKNQYTIIPILVGTINQETQRRYGKIFLNYLKDTQNLFVISSDFCHWGSSFRYTYQDTSYAHIYESIENLDRMGMDIIESLNPDEFLTYLRKYENTICGRHVIGILLQTVQQLVIQNPNLKPNLKFLKYTQSNRCISTSDSSVSYAAGVLVIE